jgi:hypothetical protein
MKTHRTPDLRTNLLRRHPIEGRLTETCAAPPQEVYALLEDLSTHLKWGGRRRTQSSRLLSLTAPPGPARVGTEFDSTGEDSAARMSDRSVVTESTPPSTFEFVTESALELKRSGARSEFTVVHLYELEPAPDGCRVTYTMRLTRASALPGILVIFRIPVLRAIGARMSISSLRGGFLNLLRMAEARPTTHKAPTGAERRPS